MEHGEQLLQSEDRNGELQSGVELEDTTFIMYIVVVLAPHCRCLALGGLRCRISFTCSLAGLTLCQ